MCRLGKRWVVNPSGGLESKGEKGVSWHLCQSVMSQEWSSQVSIRVCVSHRKVMEGVSERLLPH